MAMLARFCCTLCHGLHARNDCSHRGMAQRELQGGRLQCDAVSDAHGLHALDLLQNLGGRLLVVVMGALNGPCSQNARVVGAAS